MRELGGTASILAALSAAVDGPIARLRAELPDVLEPTHPELGVFTIGDRDAGIALQMTCTRSDGRKVSWLVEVWIYDTDPNDWMANVKAEIDLHDCAGQYRCVLNDQQIITEAPVAAEAIARAAQILVGHQREDLLAWGWEPPEWAESDLPP